MANTHDDASDLSDLTRSFDYDHLVARNALALTAVNPDLWTTITPAFAPGVARTSWWRRSSRTCPSPLRVSARLGAAHEMLLAARETANRLTSTPDQGVVMGQVDAALRRFYVLAAEERALVLATLGDDARHAFATEDMIPHQEAVRMAAQIVAFVQIAERREQAITLIDPDTLARLARNMHDDIAAARDFLATDSLTRALADADGNPDAGRR